MKSYLIFMIYVFVNLTSFCANADSFFDERYRGWYWFEQNKPNAEIIEPQNRESTIAPVDAKSEIETFAAELEALKFVMLARPTPESVKAYRDKEAIMWANAERLENAWEMANLLYPEQRDLINNPVNVHAVKAKREMILSENSVKIKHFAKSFDLVLFFSSNCTYCELLSPVLRAFGEQYGFNIEAISSDGKAHKYFKTLTSPELIERLNITAFPTLIAISHDSKTAFELIRGYVSKSELEEYSLLAIKYLDEQKNKRVIK